MTKPLLRCQDVHFRYGEQQVFSRLNLTLDTPQIAAIVGLNGSGKSTLFKLALGLLRPQSGQVEILGGEPGRFEARQRVGTALQDIDFPPHERVEEVIKFVSSHYAESEDPEKLLNDFFLNDFRRKSCHQLSGGMKRRLALACSLVGKPQMVLLDEPTTGLDLPSRRQLMQNLRTYQQRHRSLILMISHHPEESFESVDNFLHTRRGGIELITAQEMGRLTRLKKISYQAKNALDWSRAEKAGSTGDQHWVITQESDLFVQTLCQSQSFQNLGIQPIGTDELLGEVL